MAIDAAGRATVRDALADPAALIRPTRDVIMEYTLMTNDPIKLLQPYKGPSGTHTNRSAHTHATSTPYADSSNVPARIARNAVSIEP